MGSALLPVLLLMFLFSAIALGAAVVVRAELMIAERFRQSVEAFHATEAGLDLVTAELRPMATWTPVLSGDMRSGYSQGSFGGMRSLPGGGRVILCCGAGSVSGRLEAETAASPLRARRVIGWQPFLWASFDSLVRQDPPSRLFLVVFVGEDEEEAGVPGSGDANETLVVRAEAVDPNGLRRSIEAVIARWPSAPAAGGAESPPPAPVVGVLSWREVR